MSIRKAAVVAGAVIGAAALVVLYGHDPSLSEFYPRCLFHAATGLQCPGCGATRALYHLLHGQWADAIRFNLMFTFFFPVLAIGGVAEAAAIWNRKVVNLIQRPWLGWALASATIGWGVLRNTPLLSV